MYMDKQVKRGYNEYIRLDEGIGKDAMMDVALLVMEDGDTWSCEEPEKEVAALVFDGKCTIKWEDQSYDVDRPNPFDYNPSCLHVCKGVKFEIIAHGPCNIYIQKTLNEKTFPSKISYFSGKFRSLWQIASCTAFCIVCFGDQRMVIHSPG